MTFSSMGIDEYFSIKNGEKWSWRIDDLLARQHIYDEESKPYINSILSLSPWFNNYKIKYTVNDIVDITRGLKSGIYQTDQFEKIVIQHCERICSSDLEKPIIIKISSGSDFYIIDGYHRIAKTYLESISSIKVVKILTMPDPFKIETL